MLPGISRVLALGISRTNGCRGLRRVDFSHQGSVCSSLDNITCLKTREPSKYRRRALERRTRRRCRASKFDQLGSTCTHSPYHACPCAHFLGGGVLVPALPSPSPPVHAPSHMHVLRRYVKAGACAHYSACVRMRMRTESACTARLTRSDGSVGCNCTCREHAACNTTILAGRRMRE